MQIIIQVSINVARALLQQTVATVDSKKIHRITKELGIDMKPLHPGVEDPLLAGYFFADVPDADTARVVARLQKSSSVEAAYLKPPDELP